MDLLAATQSECPLCDGPCNHPFRLPPIHARYPFMTPEQIAMTQPEVEQPPAPPVEAKGGKRARRLQEDRAHRPDEDRAAGEA